MLKLENLTRQYRTKGRTVIAVDDISLEFHKGEFVSILGLSGSGKTTLVSQIGGLDRPTQGRLIINDVDTSSYKQQDWTDYRLNNIGFVFQDFNLISHLTAKENIEIALSLSGYTVEEKSQRADELLEMMGLTERAEQLPSQLSGGEKQRIAIARALANRPEIILADEPTGALDPDTSVQIMHILKQLAGEGHLVIMVTHNKYLARDYSSRIVELKDGKVIKEEVLRDHSAYTEQSGPSKRSSLELSAAFKIALNNLKLRKKSTIFSLVSLIPSMVLIFALVNFIFNLAQYQEDFSPITGAVLNDEHHLFLSTYTDNALDHEVKKMYKTISDRRIDEERLDDFTAGIYEPYDEHTLSKIREIPGVVEVFEPAYFNVVINDRPFVMVTLPPRAYMDSQYAIDPRDYPEDKDQGLWMSTEAVKALEGKYRDDLMSVEGQTYDLELWGVNGVSLSYEVFDFERHLLSLEVAKVIDVKAKTTLIENYYAGYIFIPYELGQSLKAQFSGHDYTLVSTTPRDPLSPPGAERVILGTLNMMDLLQPLREKTMIQDNYDLFRFREYAYVMPSNNFGLKHMVITDASFDENSLAMLETYGYVSDSAFDEETYQSAETTSKYIGYTLLGTSVFSVLIIFIPTLLVCVILYISILLRVKEIGILKSIGARNRDILGIFTIEAGLIAAAGTLVGLTLALPLIRLLQNILEQQYRISFYLGSNPMSYNPAGLLFAGFLAFTTVTMFGMLPGHKASRLQPNVLLKHIN